MSDRPRWRTFETEFDPASVGPPIGDRFPDVVLPDQTGMVVDVHAHRAGRPACVVVVRSASWCPWCRTQLVELGRSAELFDDGGVALLAISYDPVAELRKFTSEHPLPFPLLSDEGSETLARLRVLNTRVEEEQRLIGAPVLPRHRGVPFPGSIVLDADGVVAHKRFEQSLRVRPSPRILLDDVVGGGRSASGYGRATTGQVERAQLTVVDAPTHYTPMQRLRVRLALTPPPGYEIYSFPAPDDCTSLEVSVDPLPGLVVVETSTPVGRWVDGGPGVGPYRVLDGDVEIVIDGFIEEDMTSANVGVDVAWQACDGAVCLPPSSDRIEIELAGRGRVEPAG